MMKLSDALSMRQALAISEVMTASEEEVDVWYGGEGLVNPPVPIQGDLLVPEFAGPGAAGTSVKCPASAVRSDGVGAVFYGETIVGCGTPY